MDKELAKIENEVQIIGHLLPQVNLNFYFIPV